VLDNGIWLLARPMPGRDHAVIGLWLHAGSRHEPEAECGWPHLLEHCLFARTRRRSATELERARDRLGPSIDARTGLETLALWGNCPPARRLMCCPRRPLPPLALRHP